MKKRRIFLSLGFSGRSEDAIMEEIDKAKEIISKINPEEELEFIHNYEYKGSNRIECLGEAIKKMSTCDIVYFIGHWYKHNGCLIEETVCELYNIPHFSLHDM